MTRDTNEIDEETRHRIAFNRCVDVMTNLIKKYGSRVLEKEKSREFFKKYVYYIFNFDLTKERLQSYRDKISKWQNEIDRTILSTV